MADAAGATLPRLRWAILALVFSASAINYADRQIIALLKPFLSQPLEQGGLAWTQREYAHMASLFQLATAATLLLAGWTVDRLGARRAYGWGVGLWSLAAMAHGIAATLGQFSIARVALGVAETVNTPAAVKTTASWFPVHERSLAMGVVNTAPNLGSIFVPLLIPALAAALGWRAAFIITGAIGFVWLAVWLLMGRRVERTEAPGSAETLGEPIPRTPYTALLRDRRTWAIAGAKLLTDQAWWFLLFWAPAFFASRFGLEGAALGPPLALTYGLAACGAVGGGFTAGRLLSAGWSVNAARKTVMLGAALVVTPIIFVNGAASPWTAAALLGLALAGHQAFSTNIFALTADVFRPASIGSVIGIGATVGTLGSIGLLEYTGARLDGGGDYTPMFAICAAAYLLALGWIHLLLPRIRPTGEV